MATVKFKDTTLTLLGNEVKAGQAAPDFKVQKSADMSDYTLASGAGKTRIIATVPSLDTLSKIAGAMELPLSHFFAEPGNNNGSKSLPQLSDDELRFLTQIRRYSGSLNDSDRKLVVAMVKKMAMK